MSLTDNPTSANESTQFRETNLEGGATPEQSMTCLHLTGSNDRHDELLAKAIQDASKRGLIVVAIAQNVIPTKRTVDPRIVVDDLEWHTTLIFRAWEPK